MRKVLALLLAVVLIFGLSGSVFAKPAPSKPASSNELAEKVKARNDKLVGYLKVTPVTDVKAAIDVFVQNNPIDTSTISVKAVENFNNKSLVKTVKINDENTIEFKSNGGFVLSSISSKDVSQPAEPLLTSSGSVSALSGTSYKWAANDHYFYSFVGNFLFHTHIEATFGYNGSTAWYDSGLKGTYDKGFLCMWRVENWNSTAYQVNGGDYCRAQATGYFYFGFEYYVSCTIYDYNEDIRVSVTKNGTVYRN